MSQHIYTYDPANDQLTEIGGAGHIIKDETGTSFTKRENLQFDGLKVTDDSTNNATVVEMVENNFVGTYAEWQALSLAERAQYDTVDLTDDFNGAPIDPLPSENSTNAVQSGGVYSEIQTLEGEIQTVSNQVSNSGDAYSPSKPYKVNDLVIHDDVLYRCTTACSAAAWSVNQSCFTADTLSNAVTSLNTSLTTGLYNTTKIVAPLTGSRHSISSAGGHTYFDTSFSTSSHDYVIRNFIDSKERDVYQKAHGESQYTQMAYEPYGYIRQGVEPGIVPGGNTFSFKWTNDGFIEIWIDTTLVCKIQGYITIGK